MSLTLCLRCVRWVRTSLAVRFCILATRKVLEPENSQENEEILTAEPETLEEKEKKLANLDMVHTISDSMENGALSMPMPFAWYMLHAREAHVPENSQESEEILMEEPETLEENEKKLANLVVVHTISDRNKWNRLFKRDQNNNNETK